MVRSPLALSFSLPNEPLNVPAGAAPGDIATVTTVTARPSVHPIRACVTNPPARPVSRRRRFPTAGPLSIRVRREMRAGSDGGMARVPVVSRAVARRLLLGAQGLLDDPGRRLGPATLFATVERMGFVQIDSINTIAR